MPATNFPQIPCSWSWVKLSDICEPVETIDPRITPYDQYHYVEISSIDRKTKRITQTTEFIGKNAPSRARQLVRNGDILFSTVRPNLKNMAMVEENQTNQIASTGFCVLRPFKGINSKLLFYFVLSDFFTQSLKPYQRGTHYPAVRTSDILRQQVPFPPIDEQKRITSIMDALFSDREIALNSLSRVVDLYRLRQAALFKAFLGKRAHNISLKLSNHEMPILPAKWNWIKFGSVIDSIKNGIYKPAGFYGEGIPCLRMYNILDGRIVWKDVKQLILTKKEADEYGLRENDILMNRVNSRELVGKAAVIPKGLGTLVFEAMNIRIRVKQEIINPKFLNYFLLTPLARNQIESNAKQTVGMASISQGDIKNLLIPNTSLETENEIVSSLDQAFEFAYAAENEAKIAYKRAVELDQAIIMKAMRGELACQNPDEESVSAFLLDLKNRPKLKKMPRKKSFTESKINQGFVSIRSILEKSGELPIEEALDLSGLSISDFWNHLRIEIDSNWIERIDKNEAVCLRAKV